MKKTAVAIVAVLLTASSLSASFFKPFEPVYVSKTEHFDFIYSDETKASAELLASRADAIYEELAIYSGNERNKRFPVVVTAREKLINAYFTPNPSSRIVMYDTLDIPLSISFYENEFISIFSHELAHAMSITNLEGVYKIVSEILGDPLNLRYLNGRYMDFEGFAVMAESVTGQGRLNDPFALSLIVTAKAEDQLPSLFDAEANNVYWYRYGGPLAAYAAAKYGNDEYNLFFTRAGKLNPIPFFTTFGASKSSTFREFLSSVPVPDFAPDETVAADISRLYSTKDGILGLSYNTFYRVQNGNVKRVESIANTFDRNGSVTTVLDCDTWSKFHFFDGKRLLKTEENTLSVFPHENGEYSAIVSEGQKAVLKRGEARIYATSDSVVDAELFGDEVLIAHYDGANIILTFTDSGREYVLPDDILIKNLSVSGNKVAFSWGRRSEPYGLTRFGWFEDGVIHLDSAQHLGGVTYPVFRDDESFYFISDCTKRYYLRSAVIGECETIVLDSREKRERLISSPAFETSKGYNPFSYLWRGVLIPVAMNDYRPFMGASFITSDPAEKISFFISGALDTQSLSAGITSVAGSYNNSLRADYNTSDNTWEITHSIGRKYSLFPSFFGLSLSSTETWVAYSPDSNVRNSFLINPSLSLYWNKKFGAGYYDTLSYGIGFEYAGLLSGKGYDQYWGSYAYLRFPLLFFIDKDPMITYNLPIRFSAAIGGRSSGAADASIDLMLCGIRLDKGIAYTGLTLNRAYLLLGAGAVVPRPENVSMNLIEDVKECYPDTSHYISLSAGAVLSSVVPMFQGSETELYFELSYGIEVNAFLWTIDFRQPF